jgi:hypothetical protein
MNIIAIPDRADGAADPAKPPDPAGGGDFPAGVRQNGMVSAAFRAANDGRLP